MEMTRRWFCSTSHDADFNSPPGLVQKQASQVPANTEAEHVNEASRSSGTNESHEEIINERRTDNEAQSESVVNATEQQWTVLTFSRDIDLYQSTKSFSDTERIVKSKRL